MTHPCIVTSIHIHIYSYVRFEDVLQSSTSLQLEQNSIQRRFTLSLVKDVHDEYILFWLHSVILLMRAFHNNRLLYIVYCCLYDCFITSLHIVHHSEKNTELAIGIFAPLLDIQSS